MQAKTVDSFATRKHALDAFRQAYHRFGSVFANCLTYTCLQGEAEKHATEANKLIKSLGLPLLAKATTLKEQSSYTITYVNS